MIILDFKTKNHEQSNLRAATITRTSYVPRIAVFWMDIMSVGMLICFIH